MKKRTDSTMQVTVKCFSHVKHALGEAELNIVLPVGATSERVVDEVRRMAKGRLDDLSIRVAVNQVYMPAPVELVEGDEVALIPPVQGG